jgi:hypothetical protein
VKAAPSTSAYLVLTHGARVETEIWHGTVVIGSEAIYVFKEETGVKNRGGRGGLLGKLLRTVTEKLDTLGNRLFPPKSLPCSSYSQIPTAIRTHSQWPIKEPTEDPVLIIPRKSVQGIQHARGAHDMILHFKDTEIAIRWGQFGAKKIKDFLAAKGWPLLWKEELSNISPTDASALPASRGLQHARSSRRYSA